MDEAAELAHSHPDSQPEQTSPDSSFATEVSYYLHMYYITHTSPRYIFVPHFTSV